MKKDTLFKKAACLLALCLCILALGSTSATFGYQPPDLSGSGHTGIREAGIAKIVSVLETRNADGKVLHKAAEKLRTLNERELRLLSSLCDRISPNADSTGADIAFSLITAMIILS